MFTDTLTTSVTKTLTDAQQQTLDAVTSAQDKMLEWQRDAASTFGTWAGSSPITAPIAPYTEKMIDPALVDAAFGFTADLLAANRRFMAGLLEVWAPRTTAN